MSRMMMLARRVAIILAMIMKPIGVMQVNPLPPIRSVLAASNSECAGLEKAVDPAIATNKHEQATQ